jgi:cytochrome c-type biogenesis protein CcmE|tara:strand:- start:3800 stop:4222 length:423 start_codon:yes stop_codon:yes gene_type:complete
MYGKKVKFRAAFILLVLISLVLIIYLSLKTLEDNVVYFLSPTEIQNKEEIKRNEKVRVGGMVKKNSIKSYTNYISFILTDYKNEINVTYSGTIPNLFSEEKGVVAEGTLKDKNYFIANKILAKHDENYMPPKVNNSLDSK